MPGKHGPNRLERYLEIHETIMEQLRRGGFLLQDNLTITALHDQIIMEGSLDCRGDIYIDVRKRLQILTDSGAASLVQTVAYSYNVVLAGVGNIFRYDSPHNDHNRFHHVHRFDVLNGDKRGFVRRVDPNTWPHLQEVIDEAAEWYYANIDTLLDNSD